MKWTLATAFLTRVISENAHFRIAILQGADSRHQTFLGQHSQAANSTMPYSSALLLIQKFWGPGPGAENLRLKFARTLRTNFQAIGDAASVNKAMNIELDATREHFWKGWRSRESYYRAKYNGLSRVIMFVRWVNFKLWDYIWGHGESSWKLARAFALVLLVISIRDVFLTGKDPVLLSSYFESLRQAPAVFLGVRPVKAYPELYVSAILLSRLILVGFFLSIVIKRFSRR